MYVTTYSQAETLARYLESMTFTRSDTDGATWSLPHGCELQLVVEHDPDADINDYDCYGTVVGGSDDSPRPPTMDGAARKFPGSMRGHVYWWQPPEELKSNPAALDDLADYVRPLLEDGFYWVALELRGPACRHCQEDSPMPYGHDCRPHLWTEGVGAVDTVGGDYLPNDLLPSLAGEIASNLDSQPTHILGSYL